MRLRCGRRRPFAGTARVALSVLVLGLLSACAGDADEPVDPRLQNPLLRASRFNETAPDLFQALLETTAGVFVIEVHREWAPLGADRFYNLVKHGWYDGVRFHRVLQDFTAGWGIHDDPYVNFVWQKELLLDDPVTGQVPMTDPDANLRDRMGDWAQSIEDEYNKIVGLIAWDEMNFSLKKKITSYLRRLLPNGQANEIGVTMNIRTLRHLVQMRTAHFAEWEIRVVFGQIYELVKAKFPLLFHGAQEKMVDDLVQVSGMKMQPYEDLDMFSDEELQKEVDRRKALTA